MEFEIAEKRPELTRILLKGRLDTSGVDLVETRLTASLADARNGILDLSQVTFLSSLGIRLLISLAKLLDRRGGTLVLVAPRPLVDAALKHSSLDDVIPIKGDTNQALALFAT